MIHLPSTERIPRTASIVLLVREEIERLIGAGELTGGARINESTLALRLGVSRGPVREACRELAHTGLLRNEINRGFFVREISIKQAFDIYDLRAAIFAMAGRLSANIISPAQLIELSDLVDEMDLAVKREDIGTFYPLNVRFHQRLIDFADNHKLAELSPWLEAELHLFRRRGLVLPGSMETSNDEHRAILEALRNGQDVIASRLAERHILAGKARFLRSLDDSHPAEGDE
jgi:DNA-binding GntR family transcriptional regulator